MVLPTKTPEAEASDKKLKEYAEAIAFYLEHPEALKDNVSRAYIESIKRKLEDQQTQLVEA